jgi:hypothetical protein
VAAILDRNRILRSPLGSATMSPVEFSSKITSPGASAEIQKSLTRLSISDVRARLGLKAAAWARLSTAWAFEMLGPSQSRE